MLALASIPPRHRTYAHALRPPYDALHRLLLEFIPEERLVTDPLRLLTWGTDASFYRLVPQLAVVVESEQEVIRLLAACAELATPVTFRAAGTSLSGQAITDSVLVLLGDNWRHWRDRRRCRHDHVATGRDRRGREPPSRAFRMQDRARPGVDRLRDDWRHRRQQCQRHVLRDSAKQLSHACRTTSRSCRWHGARHARCGESGGVPGSEARPCARAKRARPLRAR